MANVNQCPRCATVLPPDAPAGVCPQCLMRAALDSDDGPPLSGDAAAFAATTPQTGGFVPLEADTLAASFPQLEILELLGQGGMGAVYKARQKKLDRIVALKIIRPESAGDPAFAERFNREARTLARLNHPGIVAVHDFGEVTLPGADGSAGSGNVLYYFVMEYVDGVNLRQLMQTQPLSSFQVMELIPQICDGLQFAHQEGVIHRDIKPENILIDSRNRVKIADFGLAKLTEQSDQNFTLTGTHQVMGTPRYMAPEQMGGFRSVDHRADIYSLGVVIYELLTGDVPMGQFEPPSKVSGADQRLDDIVLRALAREPERRFQTASELRSDVAAIFSTAALPATDSFGAPNTVSRPGVSTIMEREAVAAWRWVAGESSAAKPAVYPQAPALLMILLCVCGCLSVLLPWIDIEVPGVAGDVTAHHEQSMAGSVADAHLRCLWQNSTGPFESGSAFSASQWADYAAGVMITQRFHTFYGYDKWPGLVAAVAFGLLALVLIALPSQHRRMVRWSLLMSLLAGVALLHTFLFRLEVDSTPVLISADRTVSSQDRPSRRPSPDANRDRDVNKTQRYLAVFQEVDNSYLPLRLSLVDHTLTYRSGYLSSLGLSIVLIVLSATGVRHAVAQGVDGRPAGQLDMIRSSLASVRFSVPYSADTGQQIRFHFAGLGYQLVRQSSGEWLFHRGRKLAGLSSTDIRTYDTTLTVRAVSGTSGNTWVSCHWDVQTTGAMVARSDIELLEAEGHDLKSFLQESAGWSGGDVAKAARGHDLNSGAHGVGVAASPAATSAASVAASYDIVPTLPDEMDEAQAMVDGPALTLMAVGVLTTIGSFATLIACLNNTFDDDTALFGIPGVIIGLIVAAGAWHMKTIRSNGLAMTGCIFGMLPLTPVVVLTFPLSIWAIQVLNRPQVRRAFLIRARRKKEAAEESTVPRFSRKAIVGACLIPFFLLAVVGFLLPVKMVTHPAGPGTTPVAVTPDGAIMVWMALVFGLPGLLAPLATTVLGFVAVSDVRHSDGRLCGLGLAFLDAVFFPVLFLNGLLFGAVWYSLNAQYVPSGTQSMVLLSLAAVLFVADVIVVWWLWRRVATE